MPCCIIPDFPGRMYKQHPDQPALLRETKRPYPWRQKRIIRDNLRQAQPYPPTLRHISRKHHIKDSSLPELRLCKNASLHLLHQPLGNSQP
jgi:hypothetical protein